MKIIVAPKFISIFTLGFANAITLWPFVIISTHALNNNNILINHEKIHLKQQLELGIIGFYILYVFSYLRWWMKYRDRKKAYLRISFEREAYENESNLDYLNNRPVFAFYKYVSSKKMKNHKMDKLNKIEHIGIAVKSLDEANVKYTALFGVKPYKSESVADQKVTTSFFRAGPNKIELLEATNPNSPIAKFLDKRGEGIHHIAFAVDDIVAEMKRLKEEGFRLLNEAPVKGADNKMVCFIHPKSANGVLIELCQEIDNENKSL